MMQPETDPNVLSKEAEKIGYPVLIKAAAGGGGKGMRIVRNKNDFLEACDAAAREAKNAFGNGAIYLEKFIEKSRHVEFQILADGFGNVIHLLERECSIQRRHQKIIEETPSTALTPKLRDEMGKAAVAAAKASGYVNAGTVEFILDEDGKFYFLEVNTRLQVEHPVTEMITGIDLVRQQLEIAAGGKLNIKQSDVVGRGHAIECRIYAENPLEAFLPSPGKIHFVREPRGPGIRNDCGVYSGFTVPMEYDPILAKLIVYAGTRKDCISRMIRALNEYVILGVMTPIPFLVDILKTQAFQDGETYTDFIDKHFADWSPVLSGKDLAAVAFIVDALSNRRKSVTVTTADAEANSTWKTLGNFRP
jgi:acetyl/propionyl-CoA carboxylase alpha subunit